MPTVLVNGVSIAYSDTGIPEGRDSAETIVFGHGLLFGGWMFDPQVEALRQRYRCVTIDWRGQGDTPPTSDGYDMDTLTADAVGLIGALRLAPVHFVGLSMGGFIGLRLAARHPELLRSLTLLDTSAAQEDSAKIGEYKRLALAVRVFGFRAVQRQVAPHMFGPAFRADPGARPIIRDWAARLRRHDRAALRRAVLGVADRRPVESELAGITLPTLVLVGADDTATPPARAREIITRIPGSRLAVIEQCGHSSTLEQPRSVTGHLTDFLAASASPLI
ncbi:alpha/beta fold hydrolase [Nocardia sp. SYP-A9097]|uniref:alpha/beta fold hydrolase n=1 Tax=Nocardia sp. SYP-A9097 TaxID=2663237 RepID=UPI00129A1701|nr:alpha/beta fold hydrolase [Nocardia sp. SYP-A9097]MRH91805.1 alpha/beta fold hydrolase [Nocardia sp. SYP-A9097]